MSKKPAYMYKFNDETAAATFLEQANQLRESKFVQHPIDAKTQVRDPKKVLVTGSGSLIFDTNLKNKLDSLASELDGSYEPLVR